MSETTFLTTRPRLATHLQELGYHATLRRNPWADATHPSAWEFLLTDEAAADTLAYCRENHIPIPGAVRRWTHEQN